MQSAIDFFFANFIGLLMLTLGVIFVRKMPALVMICIPAGLAMWTCHALGLNDHCRRIIGFVVFCTIAPLQLVVALRSRAERSLKIA